MSLRYKINHVFSSPISPTENYREAFSQVVAKSKKSNKFSVKMSETWRDEMAKEERVSHLRNTWKNKKREVDE
ncbi:MAG: hypothetical protein KatS3mg083_399 [Candidatus Dojkabacteria bacterium]|nr:MAG: hypothetical protein KatS3mg083_399 [Candidatus Dojkabacteria bacterium]